MVHPMRVAPTAHSLALLLTVAVRTIAAQQSGDTARYVILFSDRHAGFY